MSATIDYGTFIGRDGKTVKRTEPRGDGCESKQYCAYQWACIQRERAALKEEFAANKQIIADKVKGKVRIAQRRNNEIKETLQDLIYSADKYHNGGVC
jgi:hypothetical protein